MKFIYTFFKFFTAFFLLSISLAVGWFVLKWNLDLDYKVSSIEDGEILKFKSGVISKAQKKDLKIISYNMGFAAGPMQHTLADDHPNSFFMENLDNLILMIKEQEGDIVLLQEVDLDSKRSGYFNQFEYIMEKLDWGYAAPVVDWDLYFPLRKERKIVKATAVISKYPIISNEYTLTSAKPNFENFLLNIFYYPLLWKSTMQRVTVDFGGRALDLYNVHLCVWNRNARVGQAKFLVDWIKKAGPDKDFIIGGDFNFQAYIRGTPLPEEDMKKTPFINVFWDEFSGLKELMAERGRSIDEIHENFTFPERNHRYDFIFYSGRLRLKEAKIIEDLDVSDHFPVSGTFTLIP